MTYGTIERTAERVDDFWMSRTPRQVLIYFWIINPVLVLACMYGMLAVTA
jgi:hypothetical protein